MPRSELPPLPEPPRPDVFQYSLASLLFAMVAAAIVMGVTAQLGLFEPNWNDLAQRYPAPRIVYHVLSTLLVGLICYLCLRGPYLVTFFARRRAYSRELAKHRTQLLAWAAETKAAAKEEREQGTSHSRPQ